MFISQVLRRPLTACVARGAAGRYVTFPNKLHARGIITLKDHVYFSKATAEGAGRNGTVKSFGDAPLELKLSSPKSTGGKGDGQNPEQLFAMGYSSCFLGALQYVAARANKKELAEKATVTAKVYLGHPEEMEGFGLRVEITVDGCPDDALVQAAHERDALYGLHYLQPSEFAAKTPSAVGLVPSWLQLVTPPAVIWLRRRQYYGAAPLRQALLHTLIVLSSITTLYDERHDHAWSAGCKSGCSRARGWHFGRIKGVVISDDAKYCRTVLLPFLIPQAVMLLGTVFRQVFPPKPTWSSNHVPDLTNKVVLVTGGNTGIGKEACKHLLARNAKVYLAARSQSKAEAAITGLQEATGKIAIFLQLDLADLDSVKRAAEEFIAREKQLDLLFLNAGVANPPIEQLTVQGFDMTFGTNVLGHFLLLKLLEPVLKASSTPSSPSRVVWTASVAHYFSPPVNFDTLTDSSARKKLGPNGLYAQSKFITVALVNRLAKTHEDGIVYIAVDPGNIRTDLQRYSRGLAYILLNRLVLWPVEYGVLTPLYALTVPEAAEYNGKYLRPWARLGDANPATQNTAEQDRLWEYCEERVKPWFQAQ
ncbi:hypothetical protein NM688_g2682 [Phlebia brevispora]|uniref:Uncharacterized protein n=1 Tax=Phlebia brevispora TaxID=194682 RepID=A0ACC1T7N8_9APHY|nr:hypothetical protein NM688_g2682 [Phlebia brevispora]